MSSIHCYYGPEIGQRKERIQSIIRGLQKQHGEGLEILKFYMTEDDLQRVVSELSSGALFASHSVALVNNAELITKKQDLDALVKFAAHQSGDSTLIFISDQTRLNNKLLNLAPADSKKIFWEMFENDRRGWVQQYVRKQGGSITPDAMDLFLSLVANNTQEMRQEIDKMLLMIQEKGSDGWEILEETIETYIYHSREESVYSLFDAYGANDFERALDILAKLCGAKNNEETAIIIRMGYLIRNLASLSAIQDERRLQDTDYNALNIRGKRNRGVYLALLKRLKTSSIRSHLKLTAEAEMQLRLQKNPLHPHIIRMWLYGLFYKRTAGTSPAEVAREEIFATRRHSFY